MILNTVLIGRNITIGPWDVLCIITIFSVLGFLLLKKILAPKIKKISKDLSKNLHE